VVWPVDGSSLKRRAGLNPAARAQGGKPLDPRMTTTTWKCQTRAGSLPWQCRPQHSNAHSAGASTAFRIHRPHGGRRCGDNAGDPVVLSQELSVFWSCSVRDLRPLWARGGVHRREGGPGVRGRGWLRLEPLAERNAAVHGRPWGVACLGSTDSMPVVVTPRKTRGDRVKVWRTPGPVPQGTLVPKPPIPIDSG